MKNWIKNSNGWQRIGVVLSVLWVLYAVITERKTQMKFAWDLFQVEMSLCYAGATADVSQCSEKASNYYGQLLSIGWNELINIALHAFVPVILGCLLGLVSVKVYRWVSNGFIRKDL